MDRKNIYIIILTITTIITSCIAVYFFVISKNTSPEIKIEEKTVEVEKVVEKAKLIDVSKNLDTSKMYFSKSYDDLSVKIENNKVYIANNSDVLGVNAYRKKQGQYYEIIGVNGKVVDICMTKIPTSGYPIFVMLMEDGTLQRTKFVTNDDIVCAGTLEEYTDIVRIDQVTTISDSTEPGISMYWQGIVATDKDGNTRQVEVLKAVLAD